MYPFSTNATDDALSTWTLTNFAAIKQVTKLPSMQSKLEVQKSIPGAEDVTMAVKVVQQEL